MTPSNKRMRPMMGTFVEIASDNAALLSLGFAAMERIEEMMSFYLPTSEISRVNRAAVGEWVAVSRETHAVLGQALEIERLSDGAFHVGGIADAYELRPGEVRRLSGETLDLGGIAKGYAVDEAIAKMQAADPTATGVVSAGGDMRFFGRARDCALAVGHRAAGWSVPLRIPAAAVATSSCDGLELARYDGFRADRTATVIACRAVLADALTKVVMMAEPGVVTRALTRLRASAFLFDSKNGQLLTRYGVVGEAI